jgi:hypothetical protein
VYKIHIIKAFPEETKKDTSKNKSKIKFDDDTLKKFNIGSKNEEGRNEEICTLILQEISKLFRSFFSKLTDAK